MTKPTCVCCGYDLTGIGDGERWSTCPECGQIFDSANPYPRPWPHPMRLVLLLVGPSTLILALAGVMSWLEPLQPELFRQVGMVLLIGAFGAPIVMSRRLAVVHAVRYERRLLWVVLAVLSVVYVIVLSLAVLVFFSW